MAKRIDESILIAKYPHIVPGTFSNRDGRREVSIKCAKPGCGRTRHIRVQDLFQVSMCDEHTREAIRNYSQHRHDYKIKWNREKRHKLKAEAIAAYGGKCACCGETEPEFLTADHVKGGGNEHRRKDPSIGAHGDGVWNWLKKHDYPDGFQILCFNCNFSKHLGNGICLHRR